MLKILVQRILRKNQNRFSQCHHGARSDFCTFDTSGLTTHFEMTDTYQSSKVDFIFLFLRFKNKRFFVFLPLIICRADNFSSFSHSLSTAAFESGIFIAWGKGTNLRDNLWWLNELNPFSATRSAWSCGRVESKHFLVDSWASTMHAYFAF